MATKNTEFQCGLSWWNILDGKHMKRGTEARIFLYLSLRRMNLEIFSELYPSINSDFMKTIDTLTKQAHFDEKSNDVFATALSEIESVGMSDTIKSFDKSLKQQTVFFYNYIRMFAVLLLFKRVSREEIWELHLASLDAMAPYFFAHDQLNYARMTPWFLTTMMELEKKLFNCMELFNGKLCNQQNRNPL
jgi:hypothetical protein